jgi:hypothetical protein
MRWGYVATAVGAVTLCVGLAMLAAVPSPWPTARPISGRCSWPAR